MLHPININIGVMFNLFDINEISIKYNSINVIGIQNKHEQNFVELN